MHDDIHREITNDDRLQIFHQKLSILHIRPDMQFLFKVWFTLAFSSVGAFTDP